MTAKTFLFTGEESYLVEQEVRRWKESFGAKYGKNNIRIYSPDNFVMEEISNDLFGSGLFAEKKLVIMYGIPDDTYAPHKMPAAKTAELAEVLEKKFDQINPDNIVVFVSYTPDKRKKLYKFLKDAVAKHQDFPALKGKKLISYVNASSDLLNENSATYLVQRVGTSLDRLLSEMDKVKTYCEVNGITELDKETLTSVIYGDVEADTFALLDVMYLNREKAWGLIDHMREGGINRNQVMGTLLRGTRVLNLYIDCLKRKVNAKAIPKEIGVHPFVIMKHSKHYQLLLEKEHQLAHILSKLLELDYQIKTGRLADSVFWLRVKTIIG